MSARQTVFDAIATAKAASSGGGEARLAPAMPLPATLRQYVNMQIADVSEHPDGIVVEVRPVGYMHRRRILIEGVTRVTDITNYRPRDRDDEQAQVDIGDDMYEREREDQEP